MESNYEGMNNKTNASGILAIAFAVVSLISVATASRAQRRERERPDLPERDEQSYSFQLLPDTGIRISDINGPVTIETTDDDRAEIQIVRSARSRSELDRRRVIVEHTQNSLSIYGDRESFRLFSNSSVRQRVLLKIPRRVELYVNRVNGNLEVGEINGAISLSGVNGNIKAALADIAGPVWLSRINGEISLSFTQLGERGIEIQGVNGEVKLHFAGELNAELYAQGFRGNVNSEVPLTVEGGIGRSRLHARIGTGGPTISVQRVNGGIWLIRSERVI